MKCEICGVPVGHDNWGGGIGPSHIQCTACVQPAPHTFAELVRGCTAAERDALAWHLAMLRARETYEALKSAPCN